jgi:hypothetical protein
MNMPVTTLDQRYSGDGTVATEWDQTRRVLEAAELFWISTVRADGRPHVTPLVAVWVDEAIHFQTGATEQKAANLSANPHVILMTGRNDWNKGLDVVVSGDAVRVTDGARWLLLPGRLSTSELRVLGNAHPDPRLRQGRRHPHQPQVLSPGSTLPPAVASGPCDGLVSRP